ncbi:MAG: GldG family protein [Firmicutes bacterium]|nr:GldG family protein [Bacillota bacterium]
MKKLLMYGTNTLISILLVLGIFILIIAFSADNHKRYDLTEEKRFTLDDKSIKIAKSLGQDLNITVFYNKGSGFKEKAEMLLKQYEIQSKKIVVKYYDSNTHIVQAREMGLTDPDTIVLKSGLRKELLTSTDEETFSNAILKVTQAGQATIGFVLGHGEKKTEGNEADSYSAVVESMKKENYKIVPINLSGENAIPSETNLIVIAGPKVPFAESEIQKLKKFVEGGGALMVMLEPSKTEDDEKLLKFLSEYGIEMPNKVIIDTLGLQFLGNPFVVLGAMGLYGNSPIVKDFNLNSSFLLTRPVEPSKTQPDGVKWEPLLKTMPAPKSYARSLSEFQKEVSEKDVVYKQGSDTPGPFNVGAVATIPVKTQPEATPAAGGEKKSKDARMVVFGNVNFATNAYVATQGNRNLFLNCISWLAQNDNLISIRKADTKFSPLTLDEKQKGIIFQTCVLLMPLMIILAGVFMLWRKR